MQCGGCARRPQVRFEFGVNARADLEVTFPLLHREGNGGPLHSYHLAEQLGKVGQRATELPRECLRERLLLLGCGALIYKHHHAPVPLEDVARNVYRNSQGEPRHIDTVHTSRINMICDC
jgi:hypothetical protein